ncbi:histidine kinase [Azospirillum thiophilum]|uniref:Histidine kinase n=1 Tax=Azospirillum thiophilum TaxID=528244 RepID=A0AAC9EX88_9PROT|nr:cache domain-containing protein [Azospirillum thiophilum]ALG70837.1 histidine kinase [Azospirillum thiophilum]KJR65498.1 histidine kinase [Azospirillum thiophilum]
MHFSPLASVAAALLVLASMSAAAETFATKDEAVAMVGKAVAHLKSAGKDKAFAAFNDKNGGFTDRDLYVVVYDFSGRCIAHGANLKLIGKDLIDAQDIDGKLYVKERIELANSKPNFWQDYKFTNPTNKKVEPKQMYCEVAAENIVCAGVYKQ